MIRMRLIREAYLQIKNDDPGTALTLCALRRVVKENKIPIIKVGRKILLNYDALLDYLNSQNVKNKEQNTNQNPGIVRKVV